MRTRLRSFALAAALVVPSASTAPDDDLIGVWGNETISGPRLRGELTLQRNGDRWHARIGGVEMNAPATGDSIRLVAPGGLGTLRVRIAPGASRVRGFWIQPTGYLTFQPYATPVTLVRGASGEYRGTVTPVSDQWSLYLQIKRDSAGVLRGAFRNPETNWRGGASWFRVERARDSLRFLDDSNRVRLRTGYDSAQRRIPMDFGYPLALTPRGRDNAIGFYPRTPAPTSNAYRAPIARVDGWTTGRARDVGMDESILATLVDRIATADPTGPSAPAIHSVLVARRGKLVLEEYFHGYDANVIHDTRSASKTLTSIMLGAAIDRGLVKREDQSVFSFYPSGNALVAAEPRKANITLAHLLTHTSGLACDDNDDNSPGGEGAMQTQTSQPDWHQFFLALAVVQEPGNKYGYCSAGLHAVLGAVGYASKLWIPDFFERYLAQPLGIEHYAFNLTPAGDAYGGGGMQLRPRDLLKFGQLHLNGGVWNGRRILSSDWVRRSTSHHVVGPNGSDGLAWHRFELAAGGRKYQEYEASGNGGQYIIVIPELELTVVFTGGNYLQYGIWRRWRDELVPRYVIGSIK